jgi:hypothetical protein
MRDGAVELWSWRGRWWGPAWYLDGVGCGGGLRLALGALGTPCARIAQANVDHSRTASEHTGGVDRQ